MLVCEQVEVACDSRAAFKIPTQCSLIFSQVIKRDISSMIVQLLPEHTSITHDDPEHTLSLLLQWLPNVMIIGNTASSATGPARHGVPLSAGRRQTSSRSIPGTVCKTTVASLRPALKETFHVTIQTGTLWARRASNLPSFRTNS
jgi:hypothetical protein